MRSQKKRLGRALEALEAPFLFVEAGAQAGAWRVLHANAPAAAALGAPAMQLPAPLWEVFTAVGPTAQVRRAVGFRGASTAAAGVIAGGVHGGGTERTGDTGCRV